MLMSYVDLAQAPYNVVANDPNALDSNTTAIRQALADHPNSTRFVLPMGDIHIHRDLAFGGAYRTAAIQINGVQHNHHDLVLAGWGPDATRLLINGDQGNTTSQGIQIADGAQRITLTGFTIACASTVSNVSAHLTTHSIELNAVNEDVVDTLIYNVNFGPGCGDGIRNGGGTSTFLRNTRVLNVTMRMFGCPAAPHGSRSGISFQKGIIDYEFGHFYVRGQKNSPFDCEPSAASIMSGFNIHDGTFDNADGSTMVTVSFDGFHFTDPATKVITAYPLTNSRFVNVVVLNGQAQIVATKNCVWRDVIIYANGTGGMAIDTVHNQGPLLFMEGFNEDLILDNVSITRDTGCPVGGLIAEFQLTGAVNSVTMTRARFVGGIWTTTVAPNTSGPISATKVQATRCLIPGMLIQASSAVVCGTSLRCGLPERLPWLLFILVRLHRSTCSDACCQIDHRCRVAAGDDVGQLALHHRADGGPCGAAGGFRQHLRGLASRHRATHATTRVSSSRARTAQSEADHPAKTETRC